MKKIFQYAYALVKVLLLPSLVIWFIGLTIYRFTWDLDSFAKGTQAFSLPFVALLVVLIFREQLKHLLEEIIELRIGTAHAVRRKSNANDHPNQKEIELLSARIENVRDDLAGLNVFERGSGFSGIQPSKESILKKKLERLYNQLRELDPHSVFLPKEYK
jgi:hypothetical protein